MIDFQAGSIRIFEQDRIIAGRIIVLLRRMHDVRADIFEKAMGLIDLAAFTGTETDVMQTDVSLDETLALRSLRRSFEVSVPPMSNWPLVAWSRQPIKFRSVVLPEPEGPMMAIHSPAVAVK